MSETRIYLDGYPFDLRSRNTDWLYVEKNIPLITDWAADIRFVRQRSRAVTLQANYKAIRAALGRRVGLPVGRWATDTDRLDAQELDRSKCALVMATARLYG
jgi:hypothetical protein